MRRVLALGMVLLVASVLETAVFSRLTIVGFGPDLLLLVVAVAALRDGPVTGTLLGFCAGLLHGLLRTTSPVGTYAIVLLLTGYVVGTLRPYVTNGSVAAPLVVAFASGLLATVGYGVLAGVLGEPQVTRDLVLHAALLVGLYNALLAPAANRVIRSLSQRLPAGHVGAT